MSETQTVTEYDELKDLVASPGFQRFLLHARKEWAEGYGQRMKDAIAEAKKTGEDLHYACLRVDYANEAINALLSWPRARLEQIAKDRTPQSRFPRLRA